MSLSDRDKHIVLLFLQTVKISMIEGLKQANDPMATRAEMFRYLRLIDKDLKEVE